MPTQGSADPGAAQAHDLLRCGPAAFSDGRSNQPFPQLPSGSRHRVSPKPMIALGRRALIRTGPDPRPVDGVDSERCRPHVRRGLQRRPLALESAPRPGCRSAAAWRSCTSRAYPADRNCWLSQDEHLVLGLRLLLDDHGAADGHDEGDDAVDPFGALVLGGLAVAGGILGDFDVAAIRCSGITRSEPNPALTPSGIRPHQRLPAVARRPPALRAPPRRTRQDRSCCSRWSRSSRRSVGYARCGTRRYGR
jgi:hypothetical protein